MGPLRANTGGVGPRTHVRNRTALTWCPAARSPRTDGHVGGGPLSSEVRMSLQHRPSRARPALLAAAVALTVAAGADPASAASSKGCEGGGFAITQLDGGGIAQPANAGGSLQTTIPADRLGTAFLVSGRYVRFTVVAA